MPIVLRGRTATCPWLLHEWKHAAFHGDADVGRSSVIAAGAQVLPDDAPVSRSTTGDRTARRLAGLSAADVYLMTDDGRHWFVRKVARSVEGNERLVLQTKKLEAARAIYAGVADVPDLLAEGEDDGHYFVDRAYVRAVDGATFLNSARPSGLRWFADLVAEVIGIEASASGEGPSVEPAVALAERIASVRQRVDVPMAVADRVETLLDALATTGPLEPTFCHGDLSLENILVDPEHRRLWVIDAIDSPFEHWWQDVAKLHQDLDAGWYARNRAGIAPTVLRFVSDRILEATDRIDERYRRVHRTLVACTLLRILPYATGAHDRAALLHRIDYFTRAGPPCG